MSADILSTSPLNDESGTEPMTNAGTLSDQEIANLRSQMLNFARLQLDDPHLAEDAVQEALACALRNADSFTRSASLKTWVFAILKHKIADVLRSRYREPVREECKTCSQNDDEFFDDSGHWRAGVTPRRWGNTQELADKSDFWRVFDVCLEHLPAEQARVFMMREFIELESAEICASLELSTSNLHVLLYRARLKLRDCLSENWFGRG